MPIRIEKTAGGLAHAPVFVGKVLATDVVKVDVSALTSAEVDEKGYLKPGVPFSKNGLPVAADGTVHGVVIESVEIAASNISGDLNAATDIFVAVGTHGVVNRDLAEDNLGRSYTAAEIAGFDKGNLSLTRT